jgi:hypothetical protein
MVQKIHEMDQGNCVIITTCCCPNQFHIVCKIHHNQNSKGKSCTFKNFLLDCVQKITDPAQTEDKSESSDDDPLASTSTASTPLPCKRPPVMDPATRLWGGFEFHKMVHVPPSKKKKSAASRKCRVCAAHKRRKETSVMCLSCGVALCKVPCFGDYHTKENY